MLDHGRRERVLSKHELSLLNFFARQVAIVLENASLISREQRSVQETTIINQIGRQVTDRAAEETNLPELLDEVRTQIGFLMDVSNFVVILFDPESDDLDINLIYENGIRQYYSQPHDGMGIEKSLVTRESNIFWPWDVSGHLQKNNLVLTGKMPTSCIGVQLRVGKRVIGGITVKNYDGKEEFSRRDYVLLSAVANQISGAINLIQANQAERLDAERLNVLRRVSVGLLRVVQKNEKDLWLTVLTTATSYFGINFDLALLMMLDEYGVNLNGRISIGLSPSCKPYKDKSYSYDDFLVDLEKQNLVNIDPAELTQNINIALSNSSSLVHQVIQYGHRIVVSGGETIDLLPDELLELGMSKCAVLPLFGVEKVFGLVIVDKETKSASLSDRDLNWLQTLLNQAALVWTYIKFASKLGPEPSRKLRVFLSHSKLDKERVRNIYETLSLQKDIEIDPWLDTEKLLPGDNWMMKVEEAVIASDVVIVCLSEKSLTKQGFIHKEISLALETADLKPEGTIFIIPLRLEECDVPKRLSKWQWFDYFENSQGDFNKLMRALRERAKSLDKEH